MRVLKDLKLKHKFILMLICPITGLLYFSINGVLNILFSDKRKKSEADKEILEAELYRQIGQLKVELECLKKNLKLCVKGILEAELYRQIGQLKVELELLKKN